MLVILPGPVVTHSDCWCDTAQRGAIYLVRKVGRFVNLIWC